MLDWLIASARFRAASDRQFGAEFTDAIEARSAAVTARQFGRAMLERANRPRDERESEQGYDWDVLPQRDTDGRWRLALVVTNDSEAEAAGVNDLLKGGATVFSQVAADIEAGRLTTREQVRRALYMEPD